MRSRKLAVYHQINLGKQASTTVGKCQGGDGRIIEYALISKQLRSGTRTGNIYYDLANISTQHHDTTVYLDGAVFVKVFAIRVGASLLEACFLSSIPTPTPTTEPTTRDAMIPDITIFIRDVMPFGAYGLRVCIELDVSLPFTASGGESL